MTVSSERALPHEGPSLDAVASVGPDALLTCDADGLVSWADARAKDILGAYPPHRFAALAAPYNAAKAERFLAEARARQTGPWELVFTLGGVPVVLALYGAPYQAGAIVAASRLPQGYVTLHEQLTATLNEVATLQREADRRSQELAAAYASLERATGQLARQARLEGVILASRELAHVLNNDLAAPVGLVDMLRAEDALPALVSASLASIADGLEAATRHVEQFRKVLRVVTRETPVGPALDLERSTTSDDGPA